MAGLLVVRLKGTINTPHWARRTLTLLNLNRRFSATILSDSPVVRDMLLKVKDYAAWSTVDAETVKMLLEKRGKIIGGKPVTEEVAKSIGFDGLASLAAALAEGRVSLNKLKPIKPFFALNSPRGGFPASSRRGFGEGILGENPSLPRLVERMA